MGMKKRLVVLTGAGVSAESGIKTFRDSDGLWEEYDVMEVASIEGWSRNPQLVLNFYNERRRQLQKAMPNPAHLSLAKAESDFLVYIITQNIDDLHERAGSTKVLHLHGELKKARSTVNPDLVYDIGYSDIHWGDMCELGSQLRPHVVWFGEAVPAMEEGVKLTQTAELFAVVGSSLNVYPAAGLLSYVPRHCPIFLVDPKEVATFRDDITVIREPASTGVPKMLRLMA